MATCVIANQSSAMMDALPNDALFEILQQKILQLTDEKKAELIDRINNINMAVVNSDESPNLELVEKNLEVINDALNYSKTGLNHFLGNLILCNKRLSLLRKDTRFKALKQIFEQEMIVKIVDAIKASNLGCEIPMFSFGGFYEITYEATHEKKLYQTGITQALFVAIYDRWIHQNVISLLLRAGAKVDAKDYENKTPLQHAKEQLNKAAIQALS